MSTTKIIFTLSILLLASMIGNVMFYSSSQNSAADNKEIKKQLDAKTNDFNRMLKESKIFKAEFDSLNKIQIIIPDKPFPNAPKNIARFLPADSLSVVLFSVLHSAG